MLTMFLVYWKQLVGSLLIAGVLYGGYSYVKGAGYKEAEANYTSIIAKHEKDVADKAKAIEVMSNVLVEQQKASSEELSKNIKAILLGVKSKQLVVIKNGECIPDITFSDSFSAINKRVNESIK